jgi:hypothetical protein
MRIAASVNIVALLGRNRAIVSYDRMVNMDRICIDSHNRNDDAFIERANNVHNEHHHHRRRRRRYRCNYLA